MPDEKILFAVAECCRKQRIALIVDEAFLDFMPDVAGFIPRFADFPLLCVLRSLTKFFATPGLCLGYLVSSDTSTTQKIRSCASYPGLDERYYRVAIKSAEDNNLLVSALRNVLSNIACADE